jgi:hypothetical protein
LALSAGALLAATKSRRFAVGFGAKRCGEIPQGNRERIALLSLAESLHWYYGRSSGVIRLRAQLLLIHLPFTIEGLRKEIETLVACLPAGSKPVIYTDRLVGIAMPHVDIPDVMAVRLREPMKAFSNWQIVGLNGGLMCKDRSMDPFQTWMNDHLGVSPTRNRFEAKNVPLTQRWKPRGKTAE